MKMKTKFEKRKFALVLAFSFLLVMSSIAFIALSSAGEWCVAPKKVGSYDAASTEIENAKAAIPEYVNKFFIGISIDPNLPYKIAFGPFSSKKEALGAASASSVKTRYPNADAFVMTCPTKETKDWCVQLKASPPNKLKEAYGLMKEAKSKIKDIYIENCTAFDGYYKVRVGKNLRYEQISALMNTVKGYGYDCIKGNKCSGGKVLAEADIIKLLEEKGGEINVTAWMNEKRAEITELKGKITTLRKSLESSAEEEKISENDKNRLMSDLNSIENRLNLQEDKITDINLEKSQLTPGEIKTRTDAVNSAINSASDDINKVGIDLGNLLGKEEESIYLKLIGSTLDEITINLSLWNIKEAGTIRCTVNGYSGETSISAGQTEATVIISHKLKPGSAVIFECKLIRNGKEIVELPAKYKYTIKEVPEKVEPKEKLEEERSWADIINEAVSLKKRCEKIKKVIKEAEGYVEQLRKKVRSQDKNTKKIITDVKTNLSSNKEEVKKIIGNLERVIKDGKKLMKVSKEGETPLIKQSFFIFSTAMANGNGPTMDKEDSIKTLKESKESMDKIDKSNEDIINLLKQLLGLPEKSPEKNETPENATYKCFKFHMNWASPSKSYFRVNTTYWVKHWAECIYHSVIKVYSFAQAFAYIYIRGSGTCFAEQPLPGTAHCEACNAPFTVCTEERCKILGKACKAIPTERADKVVCMPGICEPTAVPMIENMDVRFYIDRTKSWRNFTKISPPCPPAPPDARGSAACIDIPELVPYTVSDIRINVSANQHAKCRYIIDKHNASFDEMEDFENNQYYPTAQEVTIDVTRLELGEEHVVYVKCQGVCEQVHDKGFDWNFVKFGFEEKPDKLPPVIVKLVPDPMKQYISNESDEEIIEVWLDEAGFCEYSHVGKTEACGNNLTTKWRTGAGVAEDEMCPEPAAEWNVLDFSCNRSSEQCCSPPGITGEPTCYEKYECGRCYLKIDATTGYEEINWTAFIAGAELPELAERIPKETLDYMKGLGMEGIGKVFTYMFRCSDVAGNIMHEENSYMYVIMTYPPFEMNITEPENNSESYEREWNISVNTSRPTECRYAVNNITIPRYPAWEDMEAIDEGFSTEHEGMTEELVPADYYLYVRCRDAGGLEEKGFVKFKVLEDLTAPIAIRLYGWADYLYVETNEPSDCVYGALDSIACNYDFEDGQEMVGNMQYIHSAPWSLDHNYYIKCKDKWDNEPAATACTIIISPYEVPEL